MHAKQAIRRGFWWALFGVVALLLVVWSSCLPDPGIVSCKRYSCPDGYRCLDSLFCVPMEPKESSEKKGESTADAGP